MLAKEFLSDWPAARWQDRRLVVGVSGGADSVAVLLALHELAAPGQLTAAHLNHGWRGQESDEDQSFVVKLCADLNRPCATALLRDRDKADASLCDGSLRRNSAMLAKAREEDEVTEVVRLEDIKLNRTEDRARQARYQFFKEIAYNIGASYIVTAHTADDRVETLLHNLCRGTGPAGAASLVAFRSLDDDLVLARPLLRKRRADIEAFLAARGQSYRQDSSNLQTHYRRNFLRREILPLLVEHYPAAAESLLSFSELSEELVADLDCLAERWLEAAGQSLAGSGLSLRTVHEQWPESKFFVVPIHHFSAMPWSVVQAALRKVWSRRGWPLGNMSRTHWQAIRDLCMHSSGVVNLPGDLRAEATSLFLAIGPSYQ